MNSRSNDTDNRGFDSERPLDADLELLVDKNLDLLVDKNLDLLVDGELSEEARRQLLTGLDQTSDGWRRCALAFLEAQDLRVQMKAIVKQNDLRKYEAQPAHATGQSAHATGVDVVEVRPRGLGPAWRVWRPRFALAASFLIAFSLGMLLRSAWLSDSGAAASFAVNGGTNDSQLVSSAPPDALAGTSKEGESPLHRLKLRTVGTPEPTEFDWPMYEPAAAPDSVVDGETAVPVELLNELRRQGHDVSQFRNWVPVQLKDGRQGLVPVDQVDVRVRDLDDYQ